MNHFYKQDDVVLFNGHPIYFFIKTQNCESYISTDQIKIEPTDCGYELSFPHEPGDVIGINVPSLGLKKRIGNELKYIPDHVDDFYYYTNGDSYGLSELHNIGKSRFVDSPIVHLIDKDVSYSFSSSSTENIFSFFDMSYEPYFNIISASDGQCKFFVDISSNYLVNLQRHKIEPGSILINSFSNLQDISFAIFYNKQIRQSPDFHPEMIQKTREIQKILKENGFLSVIYGSLACRLNGIQIDVSDVDLLIEGDSKNCIKAASVLSEVADLKIVNDKRVDLEYNGLSFDLSWDRYQFFDEYKYFVFRDGLCYLELTGMLWINLMCKYSIDKYYEMRFKQQKNEKNLYACMAKLNMQNASSKYGVCSYQEQEFQIVRQCIPHAISLCSKLNLATPIYEDIRINDPFQINAFQLDNIKHICIVNNGSLQPARVVVPNIVHRATWRDVSGKILNILNIEKHDTFSIIYLNNIFYTGILSCEI